MAANSQKVFQYMKLIGQLKQVERTGWVRNHVKDPESVAEHMYRMAMMAFALPSNSGLDRDKCIKIALVHDMAESVVGDITPWDGISKDDKRKKEDEATTYITSFLPEDAGKEIYQLWLEYENQSSPESKFVKDLDKYEMLLQAYEYEKKYNRPQELQEFYDHTRDKHKFSTDLVKGWSQDLINERDRFISECSKTDKSEPDPSASSGSSDSQENPDQPPEGSCKKDAPSSPQAKKRKLDSKKVK